MTVVHATRPEDGTRPNYPYAEWLDGRVWTLVRGRDFWGSEQQLVRSLRSSANSRRLSVDIDATNCSAVRVQATGPLPPKEAA